MTGSGEAAGARARKRTHLRGGPHRKDGVQEARRAEPDEQHARRRRARRLGRRQRRRRVAPSLRARRLRVVAPIGTTLVRSEGVAAGPGRVVMAIVVLMAPPSARGEEHEADVLSDDERGRVGPIERLVPAQHALRDVTELEHAPDQR
jgi:hypothetical protein